MKSQSENLQLIDITIIYACNFIIIIMHTNALILLTLVSGYSYISRKRKIPKKPGISICKYSYEANEEIFSLIVNCNKCCCDVDSKRDICWSNLIRVISSNALPDKIILKGVEINICDRIFVSLLRNAALFIRRIEGRLNEIKDYGNTHEEIVRLNNIKIAILYDIPQLLNNRVSIKSVSRTNQYNGNPSDDYSKAIEIMRVKNQIKMFSSNFFMHSGKHVI